MLFILTGQIQTGKTRWLERAIAQLEDASVRVSGVVAPGVWVKHVAADGTPYYEKLGIDNELLPSHERISFARRADLVSADDRASSCTQAERAQLSWAIDDAAIQAVNEHFQALEHVFHGAAASKAPVRRPQKGLLVVDELGRLELLGGQGLHAALSLLDRGPAPGLDHALVVVREQLLDCALKRFEASPWGDIEPIDADGASWQVFARAFGL